MDDIPHVHGSIIAHVNALFEWLGREDSRINLPVDSPMWVEELWSEAPSPIDDVLRKVTERFDRIGKYFNGQLLHYTPCHFM